MKIVIIGAGVAGCVMARRLAELDGIDVKCLERVARDDHSEAGTGLNIGPNAVKALSAIDPELAADITAASFPWENWRISLTDGSVLFDLPLTQVADRHGWRIRWSELYRVLRDRADGLIAYDCHVTDVSRDAATPGKTSVSWTQAGRAHRLDGIDLLIAGDGRYSTVRRALSGEPNVRHVGVSIFRVLVPDTSGGLIDDYEQWFNGPNRLLAFRVPPAHIYIAGTFPIAPHLRISDDQKSAAALRAAYTPSNGSPSAQAQWIIDSVCGNVGDTHWARMQEHDALYCAADADVLYLGDAAHGMVPTLGQGATQAIEDAAHAASLIARHWRAGRTNVREWLSDIVALRESRMKFVMGFSLDATDTMLEGADPVAGTLHKTEPEFMDRLKSLYQDFGTLPDAELNLERQLP
jgi:salicylate hydroxylase